MQIHIINELWMHKQKQLCSHNQWKKILSYIYIYIYHRHENWVKKETIRFGAFVAFGVLAWMPADVQMNDGSSNAHAQWFSHWKIRSNNHDVMK